MKTIMESDDISREERDAIEAYKAFQEDNLPDVDTLNELCVEDFDPLNYKEMDLVSALQKYLDELKPYALVLSKAALLRQIHFTRFIDGKKPEDKNHKFWREGMNKIAEDARIKLKYWENKKDFEFDRLIRDQQDAILEEYGETPNTEKRNTSRKNTMVTMPRVSKREIDRRLALIKKEKARNRIRQELFDEKIIKEAIKLNFIEGESQYKPKRKSGKISMEKIFEHFETFFNWMYSEDHPINDKYQKARIFKDETRKIFEDFNPVCSSQLEESATFVENFLVIGMNITDLYPTDCPEADELFYDSIYLTMAILLSESKELVAGIVCGISNFYIYHPEYIGSTFVKSNKINYLKRMICHFLSRLDEDYFIKLIKCYRNIYGEKFTTEIEFNIVYDYFYGRYLIGMQYMDIFAKSENKNLAKYSFKIKDLRLQEPWDEKLLWKKLGKRTSVVVIPKEIKEEWVRCYKKAYYNAFK